MDFSYVEMSIKSGLFDDQLDQIETLIKTRRQRIASELADEIGIGDKIQLSHRISPQYLAGSTWRVKGYPVGKKSNKFDFVVEPLDSAGRRYLAGKIQELLITKTLVARKLDEP